MCIHGRRPLGRIITDGAKTLNRRNIISRIFVIIIISPLPLAIGSLPFKPCRYIRFSNAVSRDIFKTRINYSPTRSTRIHAARNI